MRISHQLFPDYFQIPKDWSSLPTYKLFEKVGLVTFLQAGFPTFLPIGQRLVNNVNNIIRDEAIRVGFEEMYLPLLQNVRLLEETGRANQFGGEFFRINDSCFILTPTNEEAFIHLSSQASISYRQLPIRMFQIADKFRNIKNPKGILRSKEFLMCDMVSIDQDEKMQKTSVLCFEKIAEAVFQSLDISPIRIEKNEGRYVDFLVECQEGNVNIARNPDRYQADGIPASSVGMYFLFDHRGPVFHKAGNSSGISCIGTYGFGIQRCIHAVIEKHRDNLGVAFPKLMRPFDSSVIVMDSSDLQQNKLAEECYKKLLSIGAKPLYDDRPNKTLKEKASLADFFGIPFKLIVGNREVDSEMINLKWRSGKQESISPGIETLALLLKS